MKPRTYLSDAEFRRRIDALLETHARKLQRIVDAQEGRAFAHEVHVRRYRVKTHWVTAHSRVVISSKQRRR